MKKTSIILSLTLVLALFTACKQQSQDFDKLSQSEQLEQLDAQLHKHPKDAELLHRRGVLLTQLGRINEAIQDLKLATEVEPKEVGHFMALGDAYFANGDVDHSYQVFQQAINLDDDNTEAYLKLGEIAFYSRDYDRAMENLGKVTAVDKTNRTAFFMKGYIYKETGDTNNAVFFFRKVCDLYPDYEPAFEELGALYAVHHNPMAVEYLSTAIRLEPNNTNAKYCLAMYYQDLQKMDEAEELYKQILDINSNHKDAWHNRGWIEMFYYNDYDLAIEYLTKAIQCDNQFVEAHSNRACAYELKGDRNNAEICYKTALEIDPDFKPALEGLRRLKKI